MVVNVHRHRFAAAPSRVGRLIDALASTDDRFWPRQHWPAMRLNRPLGPGASGGHGPIRYTAVWHEPGAGVWFRFDAPAGFEGGHGFFAHPDAGCTVLEHRLEMRTRGVARLSWPLVYRPLHDALIEDAFAKAADQLGEPSRTSAWTLRVRVLRLLASRLRR